MKTYSHKRRRMESTDSDDSSLELKTNGSESIPCQSSEAGTSAILENNNNIDDTCKVSAKQQSPNKDPEPVAKMEFIHRGVTVRIYQADITEMMCDSIVNAANRRLWQGSGVAGAILKASHSTFQEECYAHLHRLGRHLFAGEVLAVRASGKLKTENNVKYVINAVGPIFAKGREEECLDTLTEAILNSLNKAEQLQCSDIAIPALSSGLFGVPMRICTYSYWIGLNEFLDEERKYVKEVNFVNIDKETTIAIQDAFKLYLKRGKFE